jgi:hypothetical protein
MFELTYCCDKMAMLSDRCRMLHYSGQRWPAALPSSAPVRARCIGGEPDASLISWSLFVRRRRERWAGYSTFCKDHFNRQLTAEHSRAIDARDEFKETESIKAKPGSRPVPLPGDRVPLVP